MGYKVICGRSKENDEPLAPFPQTVFIAIPKK
jgi:hypothetical protein